MTLREKLNNNPVLASVLAGAGIVLAVAFLAWQFWPERSLSRAIDQFYYTEDDGATWFADSTRRYPPFKGPTGKDAVRAHVFEFPDKSKAVMYLSRYTPDAIKKLQGLNEKERNAMDLYAGSELTQVKKPLDSKSPWILRKAEAAQELMSGKRNNQHGTEVFPK